MTIWSKALHRLGRLMSTVGRGIWRKVTASPTKDTVVVVSYGREHGSTFVAEEALRLGYQVISVSPSRDLRSVEWWLSVRWFHANTHGSVIPEILLKQLSKYRIVACLTGYKETCVPFTAALASSLGLRSTSKTAADASIDKFQLYLNAEPSGVCDAIVWNGQSSWDSSLRFPVVLKPREGTASQGVKVFQTDLDFKEWLKSTELPFEDVLLQPLRTGIQYDIEGLSLDGAHHFYAAVWEKYLNGRDATQPAFFFFNPRSPHRSLLEEYSFGVLDSLNVTNGPWHMEVRVDTAGQPHLLDFANRFGGGFWESISLSTRSDFVGDYVRSIAKGIKPDPNNGEGGLVIVYFENETDADYWQNHARDVGERIKLRKLIRADLAPSFGKFSGFAEFYSDSNLHLQTWFAPIAKKWLERRDASFESELSQLDSIKP